MSQRFFFFVLWASSVSLACTSILGGPKTPAPVPQKPTAATVTNAAAQPAGPNVRPGGAQTGERKQPVLQATQGSRPARSFQEAESAVVKFIASGTYASLDEGRTVYNGHWIGSGFLIDPSGLAVTTNHVVAGAATLKAYIGGEVDKEFPARVIAASECMDLAVVQIEGGPFPVYLAWNTGPVNVGMDVYAAGYPGVGDHWQYTLTKGIISKTHEVGDVSWASLDYVYLHDARIRRGNSGGPLITPQGQVVGVNYAGENVEDINLAIPGELAQPVVEQLRQGKPYRWLGINGRGHCAAGWALWHLGNVGRVGVTIGPPWPPARGYFGRNGEHPGSPAGHYEGVL
ncbi:MAG: serine protease [Chloroflexi bacterium]|nr:serine protease [Chloroflexota bacterium]